MADTHLPAVDRKLAFGTAAGFVLDHRDRVLVSNQIPSFASHVKVFGLWPLAPDLSSFTKQSNARV
jgi:hypothetical protein